MEGHTGGWRRDKLSRQAFLAPAEKNDAMEMGSRDPLRMAPNAEPGQSCPCLARLGRSVHGQQADGQARNGEVGFADWPSRRQGSESWRLSHMLLRTSQPGERVEGQPACRGAGEKLARARLSCRLGLPRLCAASQGQAPWPRTRPTKKRKPAWPAWLSGGG